MTDVSNLDELALAIASSSSKIKAYALAQAAATQSQELDIQRALSRLGVVGDGVANDAPAIQAALDVGGQVLLPPGTFKLGTGLTIGSYTSLIGAGRSSVLRAADGLNADMISLKATNTEQVTIAHLSIDGNYATNTAGNAITFSNTTTAAPAFTLTDCHHKLIDLLIYHVAGHGVSFPRSAMNQAGAREAFIDSVEVYKSNGIGFDIHSSDVFISNSGAGHVGFQGFRIGNFGAAAMMVNCKAFGSGDISTGYGFDVVSGNVQMTGCHAQNNADAGFKIAAERFMGTGCLADTNGSASVHPPGFKIEASRTYLSGCHARDDGRGWQGYGFQIEAGTDYIVIEGSAYADVSGALNNLSAGANIDTSRLAAW